MIEYGSDIIMNNEDNKYEKIARDFHLQGNNCSNSLYNTFINDYNLDGNIPMPRSVDGMCGTIITTKKILKELGKDEYFDNYKQLFLEKFGYLRCADLMKNGRKCNDYVGFSANYISNCLK